MKQKLPQKFGPAMRGFFFAFCSRVANSMKIPIVDQQIIRSNKNDLLFSWTQHSGHSLSNNIMYHK